MIRRRRLEVTFETEVSVAVRVPPPLPDTCWCGGVLLTPDAASRTAPISLRELYRLIEAASIHYTDEREPRVCGASVVAIATDGG